MRIQDIKKGEYIFHLFKGERRLGKVRHHKDNHLAYVDINSPTRSWFINQHDLDDKTAIVVSQQTHPELFL